MRSKQSIKLLIADDHKLFRQGLMAMLEDYKEFDTILEAPDGQQMLEKVSQHKPDVVLLDLKMPVLSGIEAMPILRRDYPEVKVLVISMHTDPYYIASLIKEGASGYLAKDADIQEVVTAIHTVSAGRNHINDTVAEALIKNSRSPGKEGHTMGPIVELNDQERKLICLIVQELTSEQIADKLCQSKGTVNAHRRKLLKKLGVKNTAGLTSFAIKYKIC